MDAVWRTLVELGVPDGPARPVATTPIDPGVARGALREVMARGHSERERELLLAWLRAWQHHWPGSFGSALGAEGHRAIELLSQGPYSADRYLKLRRIAVANLSGRL